jgi:hypothetical protein
VIKQKIIFFSAVSVLSGISFAGTSPLFLVTPNYLAPSVIYNNESTATVYQITNNTQSTINRTFNGAGLSQMPAGMTPDTAPTSAPGNQYCSNPFTLAPGSSCLLKVSMHTSLMPSAVNRGPVICPAQSLGVNCVQPSVSDRINTSVIQSGVPQDCNSNASNFNYELAQVFDASSGFDTQWGPARNPLALSPSNPNLTSCQTSAGLNWSYARIQAAAAYWISQKLNYCHHHVPDWATPVSNRSATVGGYCNPAGVESAAAQDPYYNPATYPYASTTQPVRWNYSGQGSQTPHNWVNNNQMWYGMDCSDYTSFLYNFAFNIQIDSQTGYQAGQQTCGTPGCPDDLVSPNTQQLYGVLLNRSTAAGVLVCWDGTTDPNPSSPTYCVGHGGYLSSINSSDNFGQPFVTINTLVPNGVPILKPGDILFIAGGGPDHQDQPDGTSSIVTHAIMWVGKQVGYGPNDINPALIAPDDAPCAAYSIWGPQIGDWVITDSHYQGADYRVLTQCFYLNDLWGVRRVLT